MNWLDKTFVGLLLVVFGGIVLHAPLAVGFGTLWPDYDLIIKSWKEILMGVALVAAIVILTIRKQWSILRSRVIYLIAAFAALNILLIPLYFTGFEATIAGLFINLRFLLFFVLVYMALQLYPKLRPAFITTFIIGALVVVVFAVLQVTVLPNDILRHIGYGASTIMPYLTVDQHEGYVRINSTLRGPNTLGAYAAVVLAVAAAAWLMRSKLPGLLGKYRVWVLSILGAGSLVALYFSYSRSAAIAAALAVGIVVLVLYGRRITKWAWLGLAAAGLLIGGTVLVFKDTQFISQVILHEDPSEGNNVNSNDGHASSLIEGTEKMLRQPLGAGIGSTGSASLLTDEPIIIENQYLFIAHETGWVGLGLFLAINYLVLAGLWKRRSDWLALAVFASGVGLAAAALVLPVWVDDTVAIIWWGLAAVALVTPVVIKTTKSGLAKESTEGRVKAKAQAKLGVKKVAK